MAYKHEHERNKDVFLLSANARFFFRPGENEQIETTVHLQPDTRSAILGVVRGGDERAVPDALVMLFEVGKDTEDLTNLSQTFTDENGRFIFGPLTAGKLYLVKIFKNAVKLRELEIVVDAV